MLGNFSVKRTDGSFHKPPPDQVIEQTLNKEQKGAGGITGISTSDGAVQRWVLSSHITAGLLSHFKHSLGLNQCESNPKDLGKKRIKDDEKVVQDCYNIIKEWGDPFKKSETLIGVSSQIQAPEHVIKDMLNAGSIGKDQYLEFIQKRIETNEVDFYAPIKQNKLHLFKSAVNVRKVKVNGKEVAVRSDRDTFARLLIMQRTRDIQLQEVLQYKLTSVPLAFSDSESIPAIAAIPSNSPKIYDGMVLFQKLPPDLVTFGVISDYILNNIMQNGCRICFFVTDYCLENSIKSLERKGKSSIDFRRMTISRRNQVKPKQFQKFLRLPENKIDLVKSLIKQH